MVAMQTITNESPTSEHATKVLRIINRRSFCTIATTSSADRPHTAGVLYAPADGALWIHAMSTSRKVRNIVANNAVAVCIPFRRLPMGPPYTLHFQGRAEVVAMDDPEASALLRSGKISKISGHGALDEPDGCFLRIRPTGAVHTYGPGARVIDLIRDPLHSGAGRVEAAAIESGIGR